MYSSGSIAILGIVALVAACTEMPCTLLCCMYMYAKSHYVGRLYVPSVHTDASPRDAIRSRPPDCTYVICVRYANESAFESRVKGRFQGCDIATAGVYIDIIF